MAHGNERCTVQAQLLIQRYGTLREPCLASSGPSKGSDPPGLQVLSRVLFWALLSSSSP